MKLPCQATNSLLVPECVFLGGYTGGMAQGDVCVVPVEVLFESELEALAGSWLPEIEFEVTSAMETVQVVAVYERRFVYHSKLSLH